MSYQRYRHSYANADNNKNTLDFPYPGFWLVHLLGGVFIFFLGIKFAVKRTPLLPIILYRLLRGRADR